jgi:hypothetical protein
VKSGRETGFEKSHGGHIVEIQASPNASKARPTATTSQMNHLEYVRFGLTGVVMLSLSLCDGIGREGYAFQDTLGARLPGILKGIASSLLA